MQKNTDTAQEDIIKKLKKLEPLRINTLTDPDTMLVALVRQNLEGAIAFYEKCPYDKAPARKIPDFILVGEEGEKDKDLKDLEEKHNMQITLLQDYKHTKDQAVFAYFAPKVAFWSRDALSFVMKALYNHGIEKVYYYEKLISSFYQKQKAWPKVLEQIDKISAVYEALADEESKESYLRMIKCIMEGEPGFLRLAKYREYYHPLVYAEEGDVLIDGGLWQPYLTKAFAQQVGPSGKVFAFEPVAAFAKRCKEVLDPIANVRVEQLGLWSGVSTFYIEDQAGGSRMVSEPNERTESCHTISIDEYCQEHNIACSIIKLDIEGAEVEALKGAMKTIARHKPKLQIALYHEYSHYIDIPYTLLRHFPDYTFYIGHHEPWHFESVLYALPKK